MASYKQLADKYAARIAERKTPSEREQEFENIRAEISRLTVDGMPINQKQFAHLLRILKDSLKELGFDESVLTLEDYTGAEELAKSLSVSNDEILSLMSMVSRGPKS